MMECYGRRHAEAKKAGLMPLSDEDMQPHHSIPLNSGAEAHFQRAALSSLARNALLARLRYWHSHDDGSIASIRSRLVGTNPGNDLMVELLKHSQGYATHPKVLQFARRLWDDEEDLDGPGALVVDLGSTYWKAGYAGDDQPRSIFPQMFGRPRSSWYGSRLRIGEEALSEAGMLDLKFAVYEGTIAEWGHFERLMKYALEDQLRANTEESSVLVTEAPLNPKSNRERLTQIMFETFYVPSFYTVPTGVLSLSMPAGALRALWWTWGIK